jgi:hypothetical protein
MNNIELVNQLLAEIGSRSGVSLGELNDAGVIGFNYKDTLAVALEVAPDQPLGCIYADFGPVWLLSRERFCYKLLAANFLGRDTAGASFAVNETERTLVLWYRFSLEALDATKLQTILNDFLNTAEKWNQRLMTAAEEAPAAVQNDEPEPFGLRI